MQCLGDRHEVDRVGIVKRGLVGRGHEVPDLRVALRLIDLLSTQVGGDDTREMPSQRDGGLTIAGRTVPGKIMPATHRREIREERSRIVRPKLLVTRGVAREMVFFLEAHSN